MANKITIIVPVYNIEDYISSTVKSIRYQTYENIEIILVDDGSTDRSGKIIDKIASNDDRIKTIHKENGGVTSARLEGVKNASGDWIGFVDGDDYIEPEMYEKLLTNALKYDADISHCGYKMVFPSHIDYYHNTGKRVEQDNQKGLKDLLEASLVEPGLWNKLYRRELVVDLIAKDIMDFSVKNTEDLLMNYYLFKSSKKSFFEDFCPYHYMLRENSAATSKLNEHKLNDPIKVLNIILNDTKSNKDLYNIVLGRLANAFVSGSSRKKRNAAAFEKEHIDYCRSQIKILDKSVFSKKLKNKVLFCSVFPRLYGIIHRVYSKVSGIDKKYEVR